VNIRSTDLGQPADIHFFEAHLTYATALALKRLLTEAGAQVILTRNYGASALGMNFSAWMKDRVQNDIQRSFERGDIQRSLHDSLMAAALDTTTTAHRYQLFQFFKFLDFRARARKINDFHPNITLVLHYNIREGSRPTGAGRYIQPTPANYAMAFIPGAFKYDEFEKSDQKVDFLRLLLSSDLENSGRLADLVIRKHAEVLGVPPIPYDSLHAMKEVVVRTDYAGVFARNLYLTRAIRGPLVYAESLYQDNVSECKGLALDNFAIRDDASGRILQTPPRCAEVARAYWLAVEAFLQENVKLQAEYLDVLQSKP
jgi:N-acetylmuramoyl-L-alanine amidase